MTPVGPQGPGAEPIGINAFTGEEAATGQLVDYAGWALKPGLGAMKQLVPSPADPADWRDPRIGWGVVLLEPEGADPAALSTAADAPEPIQALVADRKGKVLRYRPGSTYADWVLRDYAGGGDLLTAASPPGSGPRQLPMYLLIYGGPQQIPWQFQYSMHPVRNVGRLDLTGDALANYVNALISDWKDSGARYDAPLVWSVDFGGGDITTLMREALGGPVFDRFKADSDMSHATYVDGSQSAASGDVLADTLRDNTPALVLTTSHGMTGPLDDVDAMRANLGLLVDSARGPVPSARILRDWSPDGAIWFAQACCSAGADNPSAYHGLFAGGSTVGRVLEGVAKVGAGISPLPAALLGAAKPLRAFIGQVEPTFDWTMRFPPNSQQLTSDLQAVLYDGICSGQPVGLAMSRFYQAVGALLLNQGRAVSDFNNTAGAAANNALDMALYSKVTANDRASTVILGDPTAAIPLPKSN